MPEMTREEFVIAKVGQLIDSLGFTELATNNHKTGLNNLIGGLGPSMTNKELLSRLRFYIIFVTAEANRYRIEDGLEPYSSLKDQTAVHLSTYYDPVVADYPPEPDPAP